MGYKRLTSMDIYDVIRRWHGKQKISYISKVTGYDRKTVRRYVNTARSLGLCEEKDLPDKDVVISLLRDVLKDRAYIQPAREILFPYRDEIIQLIEDSEYKLRPKIAFEVICTKHDLYKKVSYSSFKRFYRIRCLNELSGKTTCRIYYKRLEKGTFQIPLADVSSDSLELAYEDLLMLLEGIDLEKSKKRVRFGQKRERFIPGQLPGIAFASGTKRDHHKTSGRYYRFNQNRRRDYRGIRLRTGKMYFTGWIRIL